MKTIKRILFGLLVLTGILTVSCATTGATGGPIIPGPDESVVVVQRKKTPIGSGVAMRVYIDGEYILSVSNGKTESIIVPNGEHSIWVGSTVVDSSSRGLRYIMPCIKR
jgi:hypothetical protein